MHKTSETWNPSLHPSASSVNIIRSKACSKIFLLSFHLHIAIKPYLSYKIYVTRHIGLLQMKPNHRFVNFFMPLNTGQSNIINISCSFSYIIWNSRKTKELATICYDIRRNYFKLLREI
jgi:hypothetical protein